MSSSTLRLSFDIGAMIFESLLCPPPLTARGWENPAFCGCKWMFVVSHVCREWRHIARSHSVLWSRVELNASGGRTLDPSYLEALVHLSKNAPMHVRVTLDVRGTMDEESYWILDPLVQRIVTMHLVLVDGASDEASRVYFADWQLFSLERFRITTATPGISDWLWDLREWVTGFPKDLYLPGGLIHDLGSQPQLDSLEIGDLRIDAPAISELQGCKHVTRLTVWTHVEYRKEWCTGYPPGVAARLEYLLCNDPLPITIAEPHGFANLAELGLDHFAQLPAFPPMPVLRTLRMSYLQQQGTDILAALDRVPSVEVLALGHTPWIIDLGLRWAEDGNISILPRLHTIVIEDTSPLVETHIFNWVVKERAGLGGSVTAIRELRRIRCAMVEDSNYGQCMAIHKMSL